MKLERIVMAGFLAAAVGLTGCVAKGKYTALDKKLGETQSDLQTTKAELDQTKATLQDLQGIRPELEAKTEALKKTSEELETAKRQLKELDEAQRKMEESLKEEINDKTIKIEKLEDRLKVTLVDKILFDSGKAAVKKGGEGSLKKVANSLKALEEHNIYVEGHTDNIPIGPSYQKIFPSNWELSAMRATSVVRFLEEKGKVDPSHLYAVGASYHHPVASNKTAKGRAQNRRVEIVLIPKLKKT